MCPMMMTPLSPPQLPLALMGCCASLEGILNALLGLQPNGLQRTRGKRRHSWMVASAGPGGWLDPTPGSPASGSGAGAAPVAAVTADAVSRASEEVAAAVRPWETGSFAYVRMLQEAARNLGDVNLMTMTSSGESDDEEAVAVKRMPKHWVCSGPKDFDWMHPTACEQPWTDLGFLKCLDNLKFPHACKLHGVFADDESMYVVTSLAPQGDLFQWTFRAPGHGREREAWLRPLTAQLLGAVRHLHDLGIGHRDLSLENVLLDGDPLSGSMQIKVIDFAMATTARPCRGLVGKRSYQPPEMHRHEAYDPFLVDAFALGVTLFTMATKDYPWACTRPEKCKLFAYVLQYGFTKYLASKKLRRGEGLSISEVFSPSFCKLLSGLLAFSAGQRLHLGEACFGTGADTCAAEQVIPASPVWACDWLQGCEDTENSSWGAVGVAAGASVGTAAVAALPAAPPVPMGGAADGCAGGRQQQRRRRPQRPGGML